MIKTLFITRHYLDEMLGGPNCSKAFVRAVASIYPDTTLIYPEHNDRKSNLYFLKEYDEMKLLPVYDKRPKWQKCLDMYRGRLHRFGPFVKDYLKSHAFDIIFIDHSFTASSGVLEAAMRNGAKIITMHHNVEAQYIKDNQPSWLFRIPNNHFALKAERNAILNSTLNLTLTDDDKATFIARYPEKESSFHTIGVFEYDEAKESRISVEEGLKFVISGSMSAAQTETATLHFLEEYMPVLNETCPDAALVITGRNPSHRILDSSARYNNIKVIPNPDDLTAEVIKGNYYICPLHTGGGLKLRCMDALRVGLPILAHRMSTRGYEAIQADGYLFSYSTPGEFAVALQKITAIHGSHARVVESFNSHFSFQAGRRRFEEMIRLIR